MEHAGRSLGIAIGLLGIVSAFAGVGCTRAAADEPVLQAGPPTIARVPLGFSKTRSGRAAPKSAREWLDPVSWTNTGATPLDQLLAEGDRPLAKNGLCPPDMATIDDLYCVDRYEATLVEVLPNGEERTWSPYSGIEGHVVRAVSEHHVVPQAYISANQAQEACARSGKRLCKATEWRKACKGPDKTTYGYGSTNEPKRCNDYGKSPVTRTFGLSGDESARRQWTWDKMNDPSLNQMDGTVAATGSHDGCTNGYGVYDMVGNLHEWVDDPGGTFLGGYYQDTHINGDGCDYRTMAHEAWYHDYSTGFRCCADVAP